jgi:hypothetical protein
MTSRLSEFNIEGLFDLYSHKLTLNLIDRITIVIGPNGRGKTVCLKFIEAIFRKRYNYFTKIPFCTATFIFTGGEQVRLDWIEETEKRDTENSSARSLCFTTNIPGRSEIIWKPAAIDSRMRRELRRYIPPTWEQISPDLWVHETDGEELSLTELLDRFRVPPKLVSILQQDFPKELADLINAIDCHLIETQRLLVLPSGIGEEDDEYGAYSRSRRRIRSSPLAIQEKAQKLKTILKDTLTNYANLSQSLDRSFPLRVFEAQGSAKLTQAELRQELTQLDARREALMSAGILDTEYRAVTMPGGTIETGIAMALEIYVKDAKRKLDVFNNLLSRLDLFKELIEKRFIDKTLHIDRENGFKLTSKKAYSFASGEINIL